MSDFFLKPGALTTRQEVKDNCGGGQGMGILTSNTSPNIFLFSDPAAGEESGFHDGWLPVPDEQGYLFEYTGDGQGNQTFVGTFGPRNAAILKHKNPHRGTHETFPERTLRVFKATGRKVGRKTADQRYVGSFQQDDLVPYRVEERPNKAGKQRTVIVFQLRPIDAMEPTPEYTIPPMSFTQSSVVSADATTSTLVEPETSDGTPLARSASPKTKVERHESQLCNDFRAMLEEHEHKVKRFQIRPEGYSTTLVTDLYDVSSHVLFEAKGSTTRENVRMAIGQLMDYRRHVEPADPRLAVLLPKRPQEDLVNLLQSVDIHLVYREGDHFVGWPVPNP